ncbi:hypothetical protein LXL04_005217 [Taraxacum kok-saghyz]
MAAGFLRFLCCWFGLVFVLLDVDPIVAVFSAGPVGVSSFSNCCLKQLIRINNPSIVMNVALILWRNNETVCNQGQLWNKVEDDVVSNRLVGALVAVSCHIFVATNCCLHLEADFAMVLKRSGLLSMTSRKRSNDDDDDFVYGDKGFRANFESMILEVFCCKILVKLLNVLNIKIQHQNDQISKTRQQIEQAPAKPPNITSSKTTSGKQQHAARRTSAAKGNFVQSTQPGQNSAAPLSCTKHTIPSRGIKVQTLARTKTATTARHQKGKSSTTHRAKPPKTPSTPSKNRNRSGWKTQGSQTAASLTTAENQNRTNDLHLSSKSTKKQQGQNGPSAEFKGKHAKNPAHHPEKTEPHHLGEPKQPTTARTNTADMKGQKYQQTNKTIYTIYNTSCPIQLTYQLISMNHVAE